MQRFDSWIGLFTLLLAVGCGNTRELRAEPDDGGNAPDNGSNAPVDGRAPDRGPLAPPAQASLFFVIGPPGVPGAGCAISGSYVANIGGPPSSTNGDPGPREVDGVDGARIGCRVSGSSTFELSASAEKGATAFFLSDATVSGGQGSATIAVSGPGTAGKVLTSTGDPPCQLSIPRPPFQVAAGHIWAEFNCPVVNVPTDPGSNCSARGEFVFENCEQ